MNRLTLSRSLLDGWMGKSNLDTVAKMETMIHDAKVMDDVDQIHPHASQSRFSAPDRLRAREARDETCCCVGRCGDLFAYLALFFVPSMTVILLSALDLSSSMAWFVPARVRWTLEPVLLVWVLTWVVLDPVLMLYRRAVPDSLVLHDESRCSLAYACLKYPTYTRIALLPVLFGLVLSELQWMLGSGQSWVSWVTDNSPSDIPSHDLGRPLFLSSLWIVLGILGLAIVIRRFHHRFMIYSPHSATTSDPTAPTTMTEGRPTTMTKGRPTTRTERRPTTMTEERTIIRGQTLPDMEEFDDRFESELDSQQVGHEDRGIRVVATLEATSSVLVNQDLVSRRSSVVIDWYSMPTFLAMLWLIWNVSHPWWILLGGERASDDNGFVLIFVYGLTTILVIATMWTHSITTITARSRHGPWFDLPTLFLWTTLQWPLLLVLTAWFGMAYSSGALLSPTDTTTDTKQLKSTLVLTFAGFLFLSHLILGLFETLLRRMSGPVLYLRYLFPHQMWHMMCQVCIFGFTPWSWQLFALFGMTLVHQVSTALDLYVKGWRWVLMGCGCIAPSESTSANWLESVDPKRRILLHILAVIGDMQTYFQETLSRIQTFIGIPTLLFWFRYTGMRTFWSDGFIANSSTLISVITVQFTFHCILWVVSYHIFKRRIRHSLEEMQHAFADLQQHEPIAMSALFREIILHDWQLSGDPYLQGMLLQALENEHPVLFSTESGSALSPDRLAERILHWNRWFPSHLRKYSVYFTFSTTILYLALFITHVSCPFRFVLLSPSTLTMGHCGFASLIPSFA